MSSRFIHFPKPKPSWREELNNLQANVESLTNRINNATTLVEKPPVETYNYETTNNNVVETTPDPIISSTHSSPQNSNVTYANLSQPEHTVDDSANYAITNDTSNLNDTPSAPLARSNSIKYVNDADEEPVYYNEPPTYNEQPLYVEQPGKPLSLHLIESKTTRQKFNILPCQTLSSHCMSFESFSNFRASITWKFIQIAQDRNKRFSS